MLKQEHYANLHSSKAAIHGKELNCIELPDELSIAVKNDPPGKEWELPRTEQELSVKPESHDLVGREQPAWDRMFTDGAAMGGAHDKLLTVVGGPTFGTVLDGFLPYHFRDQIRSIVVVDTKHLEDTGVGEESTGAVAVKVTELVNVLQDRPELDTVSSHKPHGASNRLELA